MNISEDLLLKMSRKLDEHKVGNIINQVIEDCVSKEELDYLFDNAYTYSMLTSYLIGELEEDMLGDKMNRAFIRAGYDPPLVK